MFCNQCGQTIPEGSRFCNHCGAETPGERPEPSAYQRRPQRMEAPFREEVRPQPSGARNQPLLGGVDEEVIFTVRPTMIFVYVWYVVAAAIVLGVSVLLGILSSYEVAWARDWWFLALLITLIPAFAIPVYKHVMRRREVYTLTNHKLEMRYGLIAKTVQNIPLRNIQEVTVNASVRQRLLRLGDIIIESASETGRVALSEIHNPDRYAGMILTELRRRN
ncbi:MAG TPA: PH domain-containing protein [Blastocatellia bacterium]|nr:PH domain-containing protein [Blastocatellia bacterium]